jgi:hypothetical protein
LYGTFTEKVTIKYKIMKRLLIALFFVSAVAATSCKKESSVSPLKNDKTVKTADDGTTSLDKGNVSTWD